MAFALMITCLLVSYGGRVLKAGKNTSDSAIEKINKFNTVLSESDLTMYAGIEVKGSDVVNFIKKNLGSYDATEHSNQYIRVVTAANDSTYWNERYIEDIQNFSSTLFINQEALFRCDVIRDANDVIIGIVLSITYVFFNKRDMYI
jgi:hypothetical protein